MEVNKRRDIIKTVQSVKPKNKAVSSENLREFEGLSHKVEKHLSETGFGVSTSLAAADDSTSSDNDSSSEHTSWLQKT